MKEQILTALAEKWERDAARQIAKMALNTQESGTPVPMDLEKHRRNVLTNCDS